MDEIIEEAFKQTSSIGFITGKRGSGKTDLALLLLEDGKTEGYWQKIASNVTTFDDPNIDYISYMDRLEDWLKLPGKKAFFLDELGKHLYRMSFMSQMAKTILQLCQLIRKFDAHLLGAAPSIDFVNKLFLNTDIVDFYMEKLSLKKVFVKSYLTDKWAILEDLPRTKIKFRTKDIALFELHDPVKGKEEFESMPEDKQLLILYGKHHTCRAVGKVLGISAMEVSRRLRKATDRY